MHPADVKVKTSLAASSRTCAVFVSNCNFCWFCRHFFHPFDNHWRRLERPRFHSNFYPFSRISTLHGSSFIIGVTAREKLGDNLSKFVGHDAAVMSHSFSSAHSVAAARDSACYFWSENNRQRPPSVTPFQVCHFYFRTTQYNSMQGNGHQNGCPFST